jgi:hypothetical protein
MKKKPPRQIPTAKSTSCSSQLRLVSELDCVNLNDPPAASIVSRQCYNLTRNSRECPVGVKLGSHRALMVCPL